MQWSRSIALIAGLLVTQLAPAACGDGLVIAVSRDGFSVHSGSGQLVLRNESSFSIHYIAIDEASAALVDLLPIPEQWPAVAPGGEVHIAYSQLNSQATRPRQARIYWWTNGQYQRFITVDLR